LQAIPSWPNHKFSGLDRFTGVFYKKIKYILIPDIKTVFDTIMENLSLTLHLLSGSHIMVIPKKADVEPSATHSHPF
jgi:hypothetical protein